MNIKNFKTKIEKQRKGTNLAIATILMLVIAFSMAITMPISSAHSPPWTIPTYAYVTCVPNTVGVGQYTIIVMWVDMPPPTAGGAGGDRWRGFALDITKPDGTKQHIPYNDETSQVGAAWISYTPDQAGDYNVVFSWPGQTLVNGTNPQIRGVMYTGDKFLGATSRPATLHVQKDPAADWVEPPIPDYWTRPIPTANRYWAPLTSNYLGGSWLVSGFQRWGIAPNTPHILYAKEIIHGGISDEIYGGIKLDTTDYINFFNDPIVMTGKIYYNAGTYPNYGYTCVDLRTGEVDWYKNGTDNGLNNPYVLNSGGYGVPPLAQSFAQLSFGQLFHYSSVNGEGIKDHLWMTQSGTRQTATSGGTMWYLIDPNTGNWVMSLKNVPGGTSVTDQDGSIVLYSYSSTTGKFLAWNVTQAIPPGGPVGSSQQMWRPRTGAVIDAVNDTTWTQYGPGINTGDADWGVEDVLPRSGYTMNVTGPKGLPGLNGILQDENRVPKMMFFNDMKNNPLHKSSDMTFQAAAVRIDHHVAPYSPQPDKTFTQNDNLGYGITLLWNKTIQKPASGNLTWNVVTRSYEDGVFVIRAKETMQLWGYSLTDGSLLWGPTVPQDDWNMYGISGSVAYGKLYTTGYAGKLYCYQMKTGNLLWTYEASEIGHESPYGNFPLSIAAIADDKVFLYSTEHSPTQPLWRGSYLRAVNATTGKEIWKVLNFVSGSAVADGCIVAGNLYDNRMYVYGKGPSAITVSAPDTSVPLGTGVLIKGTITDQSPGAKNTPAIADADQQDWMEFLYMKQTEPTNVKGVPVHLTAIDPNGNFQDIGTVTSDSAGIFKKSWTPPVTGEYTVKAKFEGSESYASSSAETVFLVGSSPSAAVIVSPQPSTTQPAQPTIPAPTQTSIAPTPSIAPPPTAAEPTATYIAIGAIVIVVIIAAAAFILRKRQK